MRIKLTFDKRLCRVNRVLDARDLRERTEGRRRRTRSGFKDFKKRRALERDVLQIVVVRQSAQNIGLRDGACFSRRGCCRRS